MKILQWAAVKRSSGFVSALFLLAAGVSCGGGGGTDSGASPGTTPTGPTGVPASGFPAGTLRLTVSPIAQGAIEWITPLGNLNPPSHTIPTDHIYFYFADPDANESFTTKRTNFFAPGDGTVTTLFGGVIGQESRIYIRQTSTALYYLDHIILTAPLAVGSKVTAGQLLGTSGIAYAVDLGVVNESITLNFESPSRYPPETIHGDGPLKYYDEPLRTQLYGKVQRLGTELDGKIDNDIAGRLAGNWFTPDGSQLVFTYDTYNPTKVLIASNAGVSGVFSIGATDPLPKDVSVATGKVMYTLSNASTGFHPTHQSGVQGYLIAQLTDAAHVKAEFVFTLTPPADFTSAARQFTR